MMDTYRVGLLLTERCDIRCSHCWLGDNREKDMTTEEARGYIDQAATIPTVEWISFTGGEPFLVPRLLTDLVAYASEKKLRTEVVTNCNWGTTKKEAEKRLGELQNAGLEAINLSCDDFHQRYIPFSRVKNCFEAAKGLDLNIVIMSAANKSRTLGIDEITRRLGSEEIKILGKEDQPKRFAALAVETGFIPAGRGAVLPEEERVLGESSVEGACPLVLRDVGVNPQGYLLACCSASIILDAFKLGNLKKEKMGDIIEGAGRTPLFETLMDLGPYNLANELGLKGEFVNRCHACYEAVRHPNLSGILSG